MSQQQQQQDQLPRLLAAVPQSPGIATPVLSIYFSFTPSSPLLPPSSDAPQGELPSSQLPGHGGNPRRTSLGILFFMPWPSHMTPFSQGGASSLQGQPAASKGAIEELRSHNARYLTLPDTAVNADCAICQDALTPLPDDDDDGDDDGNDADATITILEMPCHHMFHQTCLTPWLKTSNTCPVCRYPLDTDNAEYNASVVARERQRFLASRTHCAMAERGLCASGAIGDAKHLLELSCGCRMCVDCVVSNARIEDPSLAENLDEHALPSALRCPACRHFTTVPPTSAVTSPTTAAPETDDEVVMTPASPFLSATAPTYQPYTPAYSPPYLAHTPATTAPSPAHSTAGSESSSTFFFYDQPSSSAPASLPADLDLD